MPQKRANLPFAYRMLKQNQYYADLAPDFTLVNQDGERITLSHYSGKWVLLYFYPKDNTPGCTLEARQFEKHYQSMADNNVEVIGVSTDSVLSHERFADKLKLSFPILADSDKEVVRLYGVWQEKKMAGKRFMGVKRTSFLISPDRKIVKTYRNVKPATHAEEVLQDISAYSATSSQY